MRQIVRLVGLGLALSISGPAFADGHGGPVGFGGGHDFNGGRGFGRYAMHPRGFQTGHARTFDAPVANYGHYARGASNGSFGGGYAARAYAGPRFYRTPGAVTSGYAATRYSYGTPYTNGSNGHPYGYGYGRGGYGRGLAYGLGGVGYGVGSYESGYADPGYGASSDIGYAGYPTNFAAPGSYYPGSYGQDYGAGYGGCTCR